MSYIPNTRGPLGLKAEKQAKPPRKAMRKRSAKREAYLASPERKEGVKHMGLVAMLPCLVCGARPVEVHHLPDPRSDMRVIPLCPAHHRREFGPGAYHYSKRAFHEANGTSEALLKRVDNMLRAGDDDDLGEWF
jgi:hypothetical protein